MDDGAIRDVFEPFGRVSIRRLFGGKGIYVDGSIVAIVMRGELMFKADAATAPIFGEAGATQWTYRRDGRDTVTAMPYWTVPDVALDDPEEMARWARLAFEAGLRTRK